MQGGMRGFGGFRRHGFFGGLRTMILSMLSNGPKNGAEIMKGIENATMGWWKPSPGSIYPMLSNMANEGMVERDSAGKYKLTELGRGELVARNAILGSFGPLASGTNPDNVIDEMMSNVDYLIDISAELNGKRERIEQLKEKIEALLNKL